MTITTYDLSRTVVGYKRYRLLGGGTTSTLSSTGTIIDTGRMDSISNPRPYVTGGNWSSVKTKWEDGFLNGSTQDSRFSYDFEDYFFSRAAQVTSYPSVSTSITQAVASSNPSRPVVDLPVSVYELREIPELFYLAGRTLMQKAASANLSYQFGWKPLLSDLGNLLDFQRQVDRRVTELSRIHAKGGARYRRELDSAVLSIPPSFATYEFGVRVRRESSARAKSWCSIAWVPDMDPRGTIPNIDEIRHAAFRAVLGLQFDASTVWEMLPWSWLYDWFGSLGDYLQGRRNVVGMHLGTCYVMKQTEGLSVASPDAIPAGLSLSNSVYHRIEKTRAVVVPSPFEAQVPFLSGRQLGILASLAILRR